MERVESCLVGSPNASCNFRNVSEIEEEEEEEEEEEDLFKKELFDFRRRIPATIKEEFEITECSSSSDVFGNGDDNVYVAVGKSESSMDALRWTLRQGLKPSAFVYLIHVFPEVRYIPTPLGRFPRSQASPEQVETYMSQERSKRRELLQKFLAICSASQVKVDTILIESDATGKAVLDLIPILNIRKLVVGTRKSSLRKVRKGSGMAYYVHKNTPEYCEVKIICEGKEVSEQINGMPSPRPSPRPRDDDDESSGAGASAGEITPIPRQGDQKKDDSISCACFSRKFI